MCICMYILYTYTLCLNDYPCGFEVYVRYMIPKPHETSAKILAIIEAPTVGTWGHAPRMEPQLDTWAGVLFGP